MKDQHRAAFLDRDGVINLDRGYVHRLADFSYVPEAIRGARLLTRLGYKLIIVTNQSGIGRGYFNEQQFLKLTSWLEMDLARQGAPVLATYHCPHVAADACACRKPKPGMLTQALADYGLDAEASVMIGDKASDMQAGHAAGVGRRIFIGPAMMSPHPIVDVATSNLLEAAMWLSAQDNGSATARHTG